MRRNKSCIHSLVAFAARTIVAMSALTASVSRGHAAMIAAKSRGIAAHFAAPSFSTDGWFSRKSVPQFWLGSELGAPLIGSSIAGPTTS